jgi:hypothetical protein
MSMTRSPWLRRPRGRALPTLEVLEARNLLNFSQPVLSATGFGPQAIATGDFNRDGKLDVVTANSDNTVSVLFGRGDGTFEPPVNYPVGTNPVRVAVGSLRNNGLLDLVTVNLGSNDLTVLLNNGDGTFSPGDTVAVDRGPRAVALADFNRDGKLDLFVAGTDGSNHRADVLLGNGDGTFRALPPMVPNAAPTDLVLGDFDRDGIPDLVAANAGGYTLSIFGGRGDGTFGQSGLAAGHRVLGIAAGSLSGNGILDLVVPGDTYGRVAVLRGNGDGRFRDPQTYGFFGAGLFAAVADLNNDGKPDVALIDEADRLSVLYNNGSGDFGDFVTYPLSPTPGASPTALAVGDFNRDGKLDVVAALRGASSVSVLLYEPDVTRLTVTAPAAARAGDVLPVTVSARLADGSAAPDYAGRVHFTSSDPLAVLPADYIFTAADHGTHTFAVSLRRAGGQQVTVADTAASALTAGADVAVSPAGANHFAVTPLTSPVRAGSVNTFAVDARDAFDNAATGYRGTVHFTSTDPRATLPEDYTFTAADGGSHGFAAVLRTSGTQTLTATDTRVAARTGSAAIPVTPAAATHLAVTDAPLTTAAGAAFAFTVTAKDPYGNTATGYRGSVHFGSSDGGAALPDDYAFTAGDAGSHPFRAALVSAGGQSLTAGDGAGLSGTQGGILVTPAAAAYLVLAAPAEVSAGVPFELTVTAYDAYGNVATGYAGTVHLTSTDPQAVLPDDYTFTADDGGAHSFTVRLSTPGPVTLTVTDTLTPDLTAAADVTALPPTPPGASRA